VDKSGVGTEGYLQANYRLGGRGRLRRGRRRAGNGVSPSKSFQEWRTQWVQKKGGLWGLRMGWI